MLKKSKRRHKSSDPTRKRGDSVDSSQDHNTEPIMGKKKRGRSASDPKPNMHAPPQPTLNTAPTMRPRANSAPKRIMQSRPQAPEGGPTLTAQLAQQAEGWRLIQQSLGNLQSEIEELSKQHRVGNLTRAAAVLRQQADYMRSLYQPDSNLGTSLPYSLSVVGEAFLQELEGNLTDLQNTVDLVRNSTMPLHLAEATLSSDLRTLESEIDDASRYLDADVANQLHTKARELRANLADLNTGQDAFASALTPKLQSLQDRMRDLALQLDKAREAHERRETEQRDVRLPLAQAWSKLQDVRVALQNMHETFGETLVRAYGSELEEAVATMQSTLASTENSPKDKWFADWCKKQAEKLYQQVEQVANTLNDIQHSSSSLQDIVLLRATSYRRLQLLKGAEAVLPHHAKQVCNSLKQICEIQVQKAEEAIEEIRKSGGADSQKSKTLYQEIMSSFRQANKDLDALMHILGGDEVGLVLMKEHQFTKVYRLLGFVLEALGQGGDKQRVTYLTNVLANMPKDGDLATYIRYAVQSLAILELAHNWLPDASFSMVSDSWVSNLASVSRLVTRLTNLNDLKPIIGKLTRVSLNSTKFRDAVTLEIAIMAMNTIDAVDMTNLVASFAALTPLLGPLFIEQVAEATAQAVIERSCVSFPLHTDQQADNLCTQIQLCPLSPNKKVVLLGSYLPRYLLHNSVVSQNPTAPGIISDLQILQNYLPDICPLLDAQQCQLYINQIPATLQQGPCLQIVNLCLALGSGADPIIDALASRHSREKPFKPQFGDITHIVLDANILRRIADPRSGVLGEILFSAPPDIRYASGVEGGAAVRVVVKHDKSSGRLLLGFDEVSPHTGKGHENAINSMMGAYQNTGNRITIIRTMADLRALGRQGGWVRLDNPLLMLAARKV